MVIKKTTIIREAEEITANARYAISYTMQQVSDMPDTSLQVVSADVFDAPDVPVVPLPDMPEAEQPKEVKIGTLSMKYGMMETNMFPYSKKYASYISDFMQIVSQLVEPVE